MPASLATCFGLRVAVFSLLLGLVSCSSDAEDPAPKEDDPNGQGASAGVGGAFIDGAPTGGAPGGTNSSSGGEGAGMGGTGASGSGGGSSGSGGAGGTLPVEDPAVPCPSGSVIEALSTGDYFSFPGTVFGSVMPTGMGENHSPKALEVVVTNGDAPVTGCEVRFEAHEGHGWGFGASATTDAEGKLYGYWVAGDPGQNEISAVIQLEGGGESRVDFSGAVDDHMSRTDSVHINYNVDGAYTEFKVQISPLNAGPSTYFSALNWKDSYAGIQFDGDRTLVLFSVWDTGTGGAEIDDQGACNATVGFGGEGTGTSCRFVFPPSTHGAVPGLPDDYMLQLGDTYELHLVTADAGGGRTANTLTFTDVTRGLGPISLGTQSTGGTFSGGGHASGFVEEWTDHGSCLSNTRAVLYHSIGYKIGTGSWQAVTGASFSPNYLNTNNEICGNYLSQVVDGKFFVSSGGDQFVGPPYVPGDPNFPKSRPLLIP